MIDIRKYIVNNFKDDDELEIEKAINSSVGSKEEEPLIGLGVFFELMWKNSHKDIKKQIINNIKEGIHTYQ